MPTRTLIPLNDEMESAKEIKAPLTTPTMENKAFSLSEETKEEEPKIEFTNPSSGATHEVEENVSQTEMVQPLINSPENKEEKKSFNLFDDFDMEVNEAAEDHAVSTSETSSDVPEDIVTWEVRNTEASQTPEEKSSIDQLAAENVVKHNLLDDDTEPISELKKDNIRPQMSSNDFHLKNQERYAQIEAFTSRLKKADGIEEFEKEPAFQRKNINLDESKPSEENNVSRFGLSDDGQGRFNLKDNNFLHDNVD